MTRELTRLMIFSLTPREPKVDLDLPRVWTETALSLLAGVLECRLLMLFCSADN